MLVNLNRFFHEPRETGRAYRRLRIAYGLTALISLGALRPLLNSFFGTESYCPLPGDGWLFWSAKLQFSFFNLWGSAAAVKTVWWLAVANSLAVLFGLGIRQVLRSFLILEHLFLSTFFLSGCHPGNFGDQIFVSLSFLMMFLPLKSEKGLYSPWLRKTLILYLGTLYLVPVLARIPGAHWWDGTASWMALADPMNSRIWRSLVKDPEVLPAWGYYGMTYASLAFEGLFPFLIWIRRLRTSLVAAGILFHAAMGALMDLGLFPLQMGVLLIACLDDEIQLRNPRRTPFSFKKERTPIASATKV